LPPALAAGSSLAKPSHLTYQYIRPPGRVSSFTADLIEVGENIIAMELTLRRDRPLRIGGEEVLGDGYRAVWFLFKDEGWDIAAVYRPDGRFTGYYVDVLDPVCWQGVDLETLLPLVDLFLDLWLAPDGSYEVLDEDEFAEAVEKGWITERQRRHAQGVLTDLKERIREGTFPPEEVRARAK
jgi:uncharacterized protein